jgi:hypothetical protein
MKAAEKGQPDPITTLNLEWVQVSCEVTQIIEDQGYGELGACLGWQNSINKNDPDRVCEPPVERERMATTPETRAKCNCDPLLFPLDPQGLLTIKKVTVPSGETQSFDFVGNAANLTSFALGDGNSRTSDPIPAGLYTVTETVPTGWELTGRSCYLTDTPTTLKTFTSPTNGISVDLLAGEKVTCEFTNSKKPKLTLVKNVTNNNGGTETADAWTLSATGDGGFSGNPAPAGGATGSVGPNYVIPGIAYALSESGPSGYTPSAWVCTGGGTQDGSNITLAYGDDVTCTIGNDDIGPDLTLVKEVTNDDGGTATADAWTLSATGDGGFSGNPAPAGGLTGSVGPNGVTAGVTYVLSESGPSGYTPSSWVCTGGGTQDGANITLGLAESVTCTIGNDDIAPTLTLVKEVTNDDGGTETADAWTLNATGDGGFSGNPAPAGGLTGSVGPNNVKAGVAYALSESGPSGYAPSSWVCTGGGTQDGANITLGLAEDVTCTIGNDDIAPTLTLVKEVTNDDGGTETADAWTLNATGDGGFAGNPAPAGALTGSVGPNDVKAGVAYALSESGPSNYTPSSWVCIGGGTQDGANITLGLAENVTCTIGNDDVPPKLKLVKYVIGSASANEWDLLATGDGGFTESLPDAATATSRDVMAGISYALSETGPGGYEASAWSCNGGTQDGANITLALGDDVTCSITNTYTVVEETAFAFGGWPTDEPPGVATCFSAGGFSNWGWTNGEIGPGEYTWDVFAGAGTCDPGDGEYVGTVTIKYDGISGAVTVEALNLIYDYDHYALYAGTNPYPYKDGMGGEETVAPGQYYVQSGLNGQNIYVIFHAVVLVPGG